jgi:hypothetical protein
MGLAGGAGRRSFFNTKEEHPDWFSLLQKSNIVPWIDSKRTGFLMARSVRSRCVSRRVEVLAASGCPWPLERRAE